MDDQQHQDATTPPDQVGDNPVDEANPAPEGIDDIPAPPELVTISWRNVEFTIPKDRNDWDMNVQFEFEDGNRLRAIMILLAGGPAGVRGVRARLYNGGARTARDLDEFLTHAAEVVEKECVGELY